MNKLNDQSIPANEINSIALTGFLIQECLQTIYEGMTKEERLNLKVFILGDNVPMAQAMHGVSNSPIIKNAAVKIRTTLRAIFNRYKVPVYVGYIPTAQNPADLISKTQTNPLKATNSELWRQAPPCSGTSNYWKHKHTPNSCQTAKIHQGKSYKFHSASPPRKD